MSSSPWRLLPLVRPRALQHHGNASHHTPTCAPSGAQSLKRLLSGEVIKRDHKDLLGASAFRKYWEEELGRHGVPEPSWSVRWIVDHVMRVGVEKVRIHLTQVMGGMGGYGVPPINEI